MCLRSNCYDLFLKVCVEPTGKGFHRGGFSILAERCCFLFISIPTPRGRWEDGWRRGAALLILCSGLWGVERKEGSWEGGGALGRNGLLGGKRGLGKEEGPWKEMGALGKERPYKEMGVLRRNGGPGK